MPSELRENEAEGKKVDRDALWEAQRGIKSLRTACSRSKETRLCSLPDRSQAAELARTVFALNPVEPIAEQTEHTEELSPTSLYSWSNPLRIRHIPSRHLAPEVVLSGELETEVISKSERREDENDGMATDTHESLVLNGSSKA
jgi:hypothetical protein